MQAMETLGSASIDLTSSRVLAIRKTKFKTKDLLIP